MATVNKNFRVKDGLIVEGTTGTINGNDILTTASTTDQINEGSTNLFFTEQRAIDAVGGSATSANTPNSVVKRDANGDFAAGTVTLDGDLDVTGTINLGIAAGSIATNSSNVTVGAVNNLTLNTNNGDIILTPDGAAYVGSNGSADNQIATHGFVAGSISDLNLPGTYDALGSAATAESNAKGYTDTLIGDATVDGTTGNTVKARIDSAVANLVDGAPALLDTLNELAAAIADNPNYATDIAGMLSTADTNAQGYATTAQNNAEAYTDSAISTEVSNRDSAITSAINALTTSDIEEGTNLYFTDERAQDAIGNLVGPGLVYDDVTGEIKAKFNAYAGAIGVDVNGNLEAKVDDTTIWTGGSANQLMVKTGVGSPVASKTYADDAAAAAEAAAEAYADTNFVNVADLPGQLGEYVLLTQKGAADGVATLDSLAQVPANQLGNQYITSVGTNLDVTAQELTISTTPTFDEVFIGSVSKQIAGVTSVPTAGAATVYAFTKADYRAGEFLVKVNYGVHTEVSKVILTLDTSDNIAITEYAVVGTNGSLSTITAGINGANVELQLTTSYDASTVVVSGTLLA